MGLSLDTSARLHREIVASLAEVRVVIETWRGPGTTAQPHASLGYRPPAPQAVH